MNQGLTSVPGLVSTWNLDGTAGCLGPMSLAPTSAATLGNLNFGVVCTQTPANAIAVWGLTLGTLPAPFPVLGVGIWIDPTVLVTATASANGLGAMRLGVPIPATAPLGFTLATQALVLDPCGSQGFTASNALTIVVQP
jgi:hypothetical protein